MTVSLVHATAASGTDSGDGKISKNAWNEAHSLTLATDKLLGRDTAATGAVEEIGATGGIEFDGSGNIRTTAFTGDVTKTAGGTALTIAADAVTNTKLAPMAANTIKGNNTGGSAGPVDMTATEATALLNEATTSLKGLLAATDKVKINNDLAPVKYDAAGSALGSAIADYFTSTISLEASSIYEIECHAYFLKTTAGTVTWTWTFSSAPTVASSRYQSTPVTGFTTTTITGAEVFSEATVEAATTVAHAASASLTTAVRHSFIFMCRIRTNAATTIQLRATESAGTITPQPGSYMRARKVT